MAVKRPLHALRYRAATGARIGRLEEGIVVDAGPSGPEGFVPTRAAWRALAEADGARLPVDELELLAPLAPNNLICIGLNYKSHADESGFTAPEAPIVFAKLRTSLAGPGATVRLASDATTVDWEAELAVVVGEPLPAGAARVDAAITAYTAANDLSDRDAQVRDGQWLRAKSFDGACPLGPVLVEVHELGELAAVAVRGALNGEDVQRDTTASLIFDVPALLRFITRTISLHPGDVICTGTPAGIGHSQAPPRYLRPGDRLETEVGESGVLVTHIAARA